MIGNKQHKNFDSDQRWQEVMSDCLRMPVQIDCDRWRDCCM